MSAGLALLGYGLSSSLGGSVTAAAAFRAGIVRAMRHESFALDLADGEPAAIHCHAARPVCEAFEHHGQWLRLAELARQDLLVAGPMKPATTMPQDAALAVVLPFADPERFAMTDPPPHDEAQRRFVQPVLAMSACRPIATRVFASGAGTLVDALEWLHQVLTRGGAPSGLLLAVDSWCDRPSLSWLVAQARLKIPGHPLGLQPGEAAVWLHLGVDQGHSGSVISGWAHDDEAVRDTTRGHLDGVRAARAWKRCWGRLCPEPSLMADHYLDANGEAERADAWGHLLSQTAPALRTDHQAIWIPAAGFGETGAARGALACVLASRAFARGYARNPQALVWLCAEDAARQALLRIDHHG